MAPMSSALPSAAAAAGAAAAAMLQRQLAQDGGTAGRDGPPDGGWTEHQTGDGRKFFFHEETQTSTWEKPEVLMSPDEKSNDTQWREYRIWDGRVFYHNKETKVSCWSMPPELRKLRGEMSGVDDRPFPTTMAEKRRAFWDLMKEKGVDEGWSWKMVNEATRDDVRAEALVERMRKQCFAELLSFSMRQRHIEAREKQRNAAGALERLIEERFPSPEHLGVTFEEASQVLAHEEAWNLIKSDVRRDEVFQAVMERLEERHHKAQTEKRTERVVRLQRLMASDPDLTRARLRWKDAKKILLRKDELQEEEPPLEALRVWSSLRDLKPAAEHEAESKNKAQLDASTYREDRKRRDAFLMSLKELAIKRAINPDTTWRECEAMVENDARFVGLREGPGATPMEIFDELLEDVRRGVPIDIAPEGAIPLHGTSGPSVMVAPQSMSDEMQQEEIHEPPAKRQRFTGAPASVAAAAAAAAAAVTARAPIEVVKQAKVEDKFTFAKEELDDVREKMVKHKFDTADTCLPTDTKMEMASAVAVKFDDKQEEEGHKQNKEEDILQCKEQEEEDPLMGAAAAAAESNATVEGKSEPDQDKTELVTKEEVSENKPVKCDLVPQKDEPQRQASAVQQAPDVVPEQPASEKQPARAKLSAGDLQAKKVDELRQICRDRGLTVSGRKQELVDRLLK